MKKSFFIWTLLLVAGAATLATASDNPSASVAVLKNGSTIKLFYKGIEQTNVKVLILNDVNEIVFTEKIKNTDGFVRPYNFSQLPEGNYRFQLTDDNGQKVEYVSYRKEQAVKGERLLHVMHLKGSTDRFMLSIPNKGNDEILISIYNDQNIVLHSSQEKIDGDFAKIYNLKDYYGKVTFMVKDSSGSTSFVTKDSW
ncbi:hypothetical protein [Chryseolinea sp. H1M3-3]|uniref:hypothetical protein n=1 Tax=Chryseolinea sp. H1M3-3 TaxID=3034144 RepID=UPI0023ED5E5B|nr:hypothetical protein [Chryseolinea sp. H1M3-3]